MDSAIGEPAATRLYSPDFIFATLANFLNGFGQQMLTATLPLYVLALGGTAADAGLVGGALALTAMLLRPLVGHLTDVWRRRPLVIIGTACYGLASLVYMVAGSVVVLVLGRVLHGYGLANYTTASNAYLADIAPKERRAEAIGIFSTAMSVGMIVGPALGFAVVAALGYTWLFTFSAGLAFAALAVSFLARERRPRPTAPRAPWTLRNGIVAPDALPIAWTALCLGMGFGPLGTFIAIYAQGHGVANPGIYFTVQALALIVARTFAGPLADRRGRAFVMVPGIIISAASLAVLPLATDLTVFMVSAVLFGIGFGISQPATMALLVDQVRPERRGLAMSTYFLGFDLGISIGSIGLGLASQYLGLEAVWLIAAFTTTLGLFGLLGVRRQRAAQPLPVS